MITCLINVLCANESKNETLKCFEALLGQLTKTYDGVKHITPISKFRFVELTDGGPGVGISNKDVQMRIAQRARILDADYLVRHHLANNDSSQNDVERCQGYVGDAICDGGSLLWEYRKPFDGLSDEEIEKMTVQELEEHELQRMEFNSYKVCEELTMRINGARAPGGYMKCYTSQKLDDMLFNDQLYLSKYLSATETKRQTLPGANYYKKIEEFLRSHCEKGQKYIEYLKFSCLTTAGSQCDYCSKHSWVGPPCKRIPRPYPDHGKLPEYKWMHVSRTPIELKGHPRKVDDFQPRVKIKEAVDNGTLSLDSQENLSEFCNEFIVEKKLVIECVENMNVKEINKQKKKEERKQISEKEDMMNFKDFNWKELVETDKLQKLKVSTLNKYLIHYTFRSHLKLKKKDKVNFIKYHISLNPALAPQPNPIQKETEMQCINTFIEESDVSDKEDEENDEDEVLDFAYDSDSEDQEVSGGEIDGKKEEDDDVETLFTRTRSGRLAGSWRVYQYCQGNESLF